ncbi:urease accessory protein UreD [Advenella mimigardefordensis DPN7]|uniref:Urease accessory protein UreD n=2 Tax=Advenella mimigardefordensis TaxID=302406 RepID=W0PDF0_ADVMD|nr:urease accessory protein UreD [Advenella mimigardefordensis DPN7]
MTARATLATRQDFDHTGRPVSRVHTLRSQAPLILRPTHAKEPEPQALRTGSVARVSLVSGAAGPLGGDDFELNIRVGAGSTLLLNEISSTLLLPGARGGRSSMRINIAVEEDATFVWMGEPIIAARGCHHVHTINIELAASARLFMRDELQFGRHKEQPGNLLQNMRVKRDGQPLFCQQQQIGPAAVGWRSCAVLGQHKCMGTVLVVDPQWCAAQPQTNLFAADAALLPLEGPAVMISALAAETWTLRKHLEHGINLLGGGWSVATAEPARADRHAGRYRDKPDQAMPSFDTIRQGNDYEYTN